MSDGEISGNTVSSTYYYVYVYGGGVYVARDGTFTKQSGGVIYGADADSTLKNTASGYSYGHAVYVYVNDSTGKKRNVTVDTGDSLDSTKSGAAGGWRDPMSDKLSLSDTLAWLSENAEGGGVYTINLSGDETISPSTLSYSGKVVNITLEGGTVERTVDLSSSGALFTVGSGVTLKLGSNVILRGLSNNTAALVKVESYGKLEMNSGSKISGNINSSSTYGGGVSVASGGVFIMSGGEISGNTNADASASSTSYGGGVYVASNGTFTMNGGKISGNTTVATYISSTSYGGGVYVSGTFTMSGGEISGNTASSISSTYYGGGVYVNSSGTFTKQSGGIIYGSNASSTLKNAASDGHAVYVYVSSSSSKKRNTTVGEGVTLDSTKTGAEGGWEE
jgi:hypothetical protein